MWHGLSSPSADYASRVRATEREMIDKNRQAEEHYERGNQFDDAGDAARAIQEWEIAVQLNPNYFDAHYNLAVGYSDQGDLVRAVDEMETAYGLEPDDRDARRELAQMLIERGDALIAQKDGARATQDWERAVEVDSENALAHFKLGEAYADGGKFSDAENHLCEAIRWNHLFADAYDQLAEILVTQNRTRDAIDLLRQALNTFHATPRRRSILGTEVTGNSKLGDIPPIEALPLDTSVSDLARDLAELELDNGDPDQAMAALEQAEPEEEDAEMWKEIAQALRSRGENESAEIAQNRALGLERGEIVEEEPLDPKARAALAENNFTDGEAAYERGDLEQAFEFYSEAVRLNPDHADAHYSLGLVYHEEEKYELAEKEFRETLRIDPQSSAAHDCLGEIFDAQQDWQNALREYRDALRIDPDDQDARKGLIWDLLETNALSAAENELAQKKLDTAVAADLWEEMGKMYAERADRANAVAAYRRALSLNRDLPEARAALKRLGG